MAEDGTEDPKQDDGPGSRTFGENVRYGSVTLYNVAGCVESEYM